jgi:hypothetical protein
VEGGVFIGQKGHVLSKVEIHGTNVKHAHTQLWIQTQMIKVIYTRNHISIIHAGQVVIHVGQVIIHAIYFLCNLNSIRTHLPLTCSAQFLPSINLKSLNSPVVKMWFEHIGWFLVLDSGSRLQVLFPPPFLYVYTSEPSVF